MNGNETPILWFSGVIFSILYLGLDARQHSSGDGAVTQHLSGLPLHQSNEQRWQAGNFDLDAVCSVSTGETGCRKCRRRSRPEGPSCRERRLSNTRQQLTRDFRANYATSSMPVFCSFVSPLFLIVRRHFTFRSRGLGTAAGSCFAFR